MSRIYNKHMDQVIRSVEPTLGQEKTKAFKRNLESKKLFKKAEARKIEKQTENKAKGGRVGKKFGGGMDMSKRKTNIQKIKETFGPKSKNKNLKPVDKKKNPGLAKLPIEVRNKMGYAKKGGRA